MSEMLFFSEYHHNKNLKKRPGLKNVELMYKHLPSIRLQYSKPSIHLQKLVDSLKLDLTKRWVTDDPWDLARKVKKILQNFL